MRLIIVPFQFAAPARRVSGLAAGQPGPKDPADVRLTVTEG